MFILHQKGMLNTNAAGSFYYSASVAKLDKDLSWNNFLSDTLQFWQGKKMHVMISFHKKLLYFIFQLGAPIFIAKL